MSDENARPDKAQSARPTGKRRRSTNAPRPSAAESVIVASDKRSEEKEQSSRNPFRALIAFFTQVFSEIRKVIWPTRRQMVVYTIVVLLFLVVTTAIVSGVDYGAGKLVELVFDNHA